MDHPGDTRGLLSTHFVLKEASRKADSLSCQTTPWGRRAPCRRTFLRGEALRNVLSGVMFLGREDIDRGKTCRQVTSINITRVRPR